MQQYYDLTRFISAQQRDHTVALRELKDGRKRSHWIWYIFPQIRGLGFSGMSRKYAIQSLNEARAYFADPYLRGNYLELCNVLLALDTDRVQEVFDFPDDMKLRSSLTLFLYASDRDPVIQAVLDKFFGGQPDRNTLDILGL